ncbi:cysteine--tRNA ligase [bacterium]|nr:MAG: cysteine--tRNA ligase [bacterium]
MPISIYNSLTRKKEQFQPLNPQEIKIYVCGPTVYDLPHIGHARSAYIFDVIRRYLVYKGYKVKFVRNVTDVDDKIIEKARAEFKGEDLNTGIKKTADKYLDLYHKALLDLGIGNKAQDILEPKASEYIGRMIDFIKRLIDRGAAYAAGGDVYFNIAQARNYGKLSNQSLDKLEAGARVGPAENKKNPLDFALWKSAKENEPSWESPWGKGRPGWHIECSVMSLDILGEEFDIHGGGIDLIFPHHENEIAQSEGAGCKFARCWIHHGLLTINGQKMAKSLGNFITVENFIEKYKNADLLKLFFLSTHYSHPIDYTEEKIQEAAKCKDNFDMFFQKASTWKQFWNHWYSKPELVALRNKTKTPFAERDKVEVNRILEKFEQAMDDDFNTPQALGYLFGLRDLGLKFISFDKEEGFSYVELNLKKFLNLFGILPLDYNLSENGLKLCVDEEIARIKKDYKTSDALREKAICEHNFAISNTANNITANIVKINIPDN